MLVMLGRVASPRQLAIFSARAEDLPFVAAGRDRAVAITECSPSRAERRRE